MSFQAEVQVRNDFISKKLQSYLKETHKIQKFTPLILVQYVQLNYSEDLTICIDYFRIFITMFRGRNRLLKGISNPQISQVKLTLTAYLPARIDIQSFKKKKEGFTE